MRSHSFTPLLSRPAWLTQAFLQRSSQPLPASPTRHLRLSEQIVRLLAIRFQPNSSHSRRLSTFLLSGERGHRSLEEASFEEGPQDLEHYVETD